MELIRSAKIFTAQDAEIAKIEAELHQARADLHNALNEVGAKVSHVEAALTPEHLVRTYPMTAVCAAGALGFVLGSFFRRKLTAPIAIVALLGYAIARELAPEGRHD
jgi:ElaB/YqjD/DUF883 family membrane-anchored ribosome-binding protein